MGYVKHEVVSFSLTCDECGKKKKGREDKLINERWLWYRVNDEKFSYCPEHRDQVATKIKQFFRD